MKRWNLALLACVALCGLSACTSPARPATESVAPPQPTARPENCVTSPGTQPLLLETGLFAEALGEAGFRQAEVQAIAYGEECRDSRSGEVQGFAVLQTDFYLTFEVPSLTDGQACQVPGRRRYLEGHWRASFRDRFRTRSHCLLALWPSMRRPDHPCQRSPGKQAGHRS